MPVDVLFSVVALACQGFGIWLFGTSAADKLGDFPRFAAALGAYQLLPQPLTKIAAAAIVVLELAAAIVLLAIVLVPVGANTLGLIAPLLLISYAIAMAANLMRGRRSIDCGCGGMPMPLSRSLVVRNLLISTMLIWSLSPKVVTDELTASAWLPLLALASAAGLSFVYLIFNQLLANRAVHQRLWLPR